MIEDYDINEVGAEIRRLCAERDSLQRRLDRILGGDEIESDRLTSTDDQLVKALAERDEAQSTAINERVARTVEINALAAERDEALAEVDRYKEVWDCDGETHGPWCREWGRMEAEIEGLRAKLAKANECHYPTSDLIAERDALQRRVNHLLAGEENQ